MRVIARNVGDRIWHLKFTLSYAVIALTSLTAMMLYLNTVVAGLDRAFQLLLSGVILITGAIVAVSAFLWLYERETMQVA